LTRQRIFVWLGLSVLFISLVICGDLQAKETYKVQRGDTIARIAGKMGVTPGALKAANQMKGSSLKVNQTLIIPSPKIKKVSNAKPSPKIKSVSKAKTSAQINKVTKSKPSPRRQGDLYVVKKRDTLAGIAKLTGVPVAELREINNLPGSALKIGQKLSLKKPEAEEQPELLAGYSEDEAETEATDGAVLSPDKALAEIERRKKESAALLGKWSSPDEPELLVKAAMGFLGAPYRLGGFSAQGIDCSGLVKKIYQLFDIELPRTANEQSRVGMRVARGDLSEGDLLFFNTRRRGGHVAIYIGNNEFVHAATRKKGVRVDNLDEPYFSKRFIRAVRVKGNDDGL
jgi:cell wall-associated NlpC family hydrolase